MSENKWTPEPWPEYEDDGWSDTPGITKIDDEDYARARECVNALAGEKDPAQFVKLKWDYEKELFDIRYLLKAPHEMTTLETVTAMMNQREELAEQCDLLQKGLESCMKQREELAESVKRLSAIIHNHLNV